MSDMVSALQQDHGGQPQRDTSLEEAQGGLGRGSTRPTLVVRDCFQSKGHSKTLAEGQGEEEGSREGHSVRKSTDVRGAMSKGH